MVTIEKGHGLLTVAELQRMTLEETIAEAAIEGRKLTEIEQERLIKVWRTKISCMLLAMKNFHKLPEIEQWSHALHIYGVQRLRTKVNNCEICMADSITDKNLSCRNADGEKLRDTRGCVIYRFELMRCGRKNSKFPHLADRPHIMCKDCLSRWTERGCAFCRQQHTNEDIKI